MTDAPNTEQPLTAEAATARRAELVADAAFVERYLAGGVPERAEMFKVHEAMSVDPANSAQAVQTELQIDTLKNIADLSDAHIDEIRTGRAVTPEERRFAEDLKSRLMRDQAFVRKYLDGDREAATKITLLSIVLSARVQEPQQK